MDVQGKIGIEVLKESQRRVEGGRGHGGERENGMRNFEGAI
jgi:hypothetical protein